ncbi:hypothetical protein [Bacillus sp. ISL-7]|uniref:hypothetical protein n=1 Tax=Bacillus sp. ISL-7 TaxID=2819136 RepID=UPI001BE6B0DE|nr:hypothetical protein [Bacillus sp. ISL-7]MBT2736600.1 hypothetical protein [Bacillus sp. ISL-7]
MAVVSVIGIGVNTGTANPAAVFGVNLKGDGGASTNIGDGGAAGPGGKITWSIRTVAVRVRFVWLLSVTITILQGLGG